MKTDALIEKESPVLANSLYSNQKDLNVDHAEHDVSESNDMNDMAKFLKYLMNQSEHAFVRLRSTNFLPVKLFFSKKSYVRVSAREVSE